MRLHENRELFSDALQAASQPVEDGGLGIKSIFIEKDYWICRSLALMAANDKGNRAIFKGGTSLTKAYGIGSRFSEDIDIAISEAWTLSGNQLKLLIKRTAKSIRKDCRKWKCQVSRAKVLITTRHTILIHEPLTRYKWVPLKQDSYLLRSTLLPIHIHFKNVDYKVS